MVSPGYNKLTKGPFYNDAINGLVQDCCNCNGSAVDYIIKTHVRGFFDTDLHEVSWPYATLEAEWVLSSTDRVKISVKEAIQNGFLFLFHT